MAQQQIKGATGDLGSGGALDTYVVPGSVIITPYAVSAIFDGSGSSGSFLPCLTFRTQTGAVIARCPAPEVASGDVAEASWFPHVAQASSPTPPPPSGALSWAYISGSGTTTCPVSNTTSLQATAGRFYTNDGATFASATTGGIHGISITAQGHYLVQNTAVLFGSIVDGTLYEINNAGGGDDAGFFGGKPVANIGSASLDDESVVSVINIMTVQSADTPTDAIISQITNSGSGTVHMQNTGIMVQQLDTDETELF